MGSSERCEVYVVGTQCGQVSGHDGPHQFREDRYAIAEIPAPNPKSLLRADLYQAHEELTAEALELMTRKNQDYACQADPYRNFRAFGTLGVLVRISDKFSRLRSFEENGSFAVADEKLRDTVLDAINYLVIYYQMKQEIRPAPPLPGPPNPFPMNDEDIPF